MIRVAILGCAHPHIRDLRTLLSERRVVCAGVWDADADRAAAWARSLGAPVLADPREICRDESIEAAFVLSETGRHLELAAPALEAGKHVFVEKPLEDAADRADELARAAASSEGTFDVGYFLRDVPAHRAMRSLIRDGSLGRILRIRANFAHPGARDGWFDEAPWVFDPELAGFGGFGDLGIHLLDLVRWMTGQNLARGAARVGRLEEGAPIDHFGEALLDTTDGALVSLSAGWVEAPMTMSIAAHGTLASATVVDGRLEAGDVAVDLGAIPVEPASAASAQARFLASAEMSRPSPGRVDAHTAADDVRTLEALYRAARDGAWVDLCVSPFSRRYRWP